MNKASAKPWLAALQGRAPVRKREDDIYSRLRVKTIYKLYISQANVSRAAGLAVFGPVALAGARRITAGRCIFGVSL